MHKNFSHCDIDILTNLSYISKVAECHFNYVVNMKRHRYSAQTWLKLMTRIVLIEHPKHFFILYGNYSASLLAGDTNNKPASYLR